MSRRCAESPAPAYYKRQALGMSSTREPFADVQAAVDRTRGRNRAECNNGTMRPELPLGRVAAPQRPPVISGSPSVDGPVVFAGGSVTDQRSGRMAATAYRLIGGPFYEERALWGLCSSRKPGRCSTCPRSRRCTLVMGCAWSGHRTNPRHPEVARTLNPERDETPVHTGFRVSQGT